MKRKLSEMWLLITADRKRTTILGTLLIVLIGVSVQTVWSRGPKRARAAAHSAGEEGDRTDSRTPTGVAGDVPVSELISITRALPISRDIFRLNDEAFPPPQTEPAQQLTGDGTKSDTGSVETLVAEPPPTVDDVNRRVTQEASCLRLWSAVTGGNRPTAVIEIVNGRRKERRSVLAPGQTIEGFTVVSIATEHVVLEKEGVRVVLTRDLPEH